MKILVIRHAIAMEREDFSLPNDDLRPLTSEGKKEFAKLTNYYKKLYPNVQYFYSSPLERAKQTADIITKKFKKKYSIIEELRPTGDPKALLKKMLTHKTGFIAIIGHDPSLSEFVGFMLSSKNSSPVKLKKGGACLLELSEKTQLVTLHSPNSLLKFKI